MSERVARCRCGALVATCTGEPVRVSICHCLSCKQRTGGAFSWNARFPAAQVRLEGKFTAFARANDAAGTTTYCFCPACGDVVVYGSDSDPDVLAIPAGAFSDPLFPAPEVSVYSHRQVPWIEITAEPLAVR